MIRSTKRFLPWALAAASFTLASTPSARAEGGTPQQRMACMSDAMTYCAGAVPDETKIEACLRRQRTRISLACRAVLDADTSRGPGVSAAPR